LFAADAAEQRRGAKQHNDSRDRTFEEPQKEEVVRSEVLDPEREDDKPEPDTLPEEPDLNPPDSGRTDGS